MTATRASAPGKLMLFGEYAVLDGYRALAMCFDRRISCTARRGGDRIVVEAPGVFEPTVDLHVSDLALETPPDPRLELLWPVLRKHAGGGVRLVFEAGFPPTWGLGSSSASTLAAAAALAGPGRERFTEVRDAQRALQGSASGYDAATQLLGGYVVYRDGRPAELTTVEAGGDPRWIVAWTGSKVGTAGMIRSVRERFGRGHVVYAQISALAEEGIEHLVAGDLRALGEAMNRGQALLERLGAVPAKLGATVRALQNTPSVLGARMCGAGGGDCVLVLADDVTSAAAAIRRQGWQVLDLKPEPEGLIVQEVS